MKLIDLPKLRQTYGYDCGAKALQSVLVYYGIKVREDKIMSSAQTSTEGTPMQGIVKTAQKYGLKTESRQMSISDIKSFIRRKIPVIIVLQAWTAKAEINWEKDWKDGHYVVAIGYTKDKIIFEDPSSFQRTYLEYNELEKRWHDIGVDKKYYLHHGVAVFGKSPELKASQIVHMD